MKNKDVQKLFVLAQEYKFESRFRWAIEDTFRWDIIPHSVRNEGMSEEKVVRRVLSWLPHAYLLNIDKHARIADAYSAYIRSKERIAAEWEPIFANIIFFSWSEDREAFLTQENFEASRDEFFASSARATQENPEAVSDVGRLFFMHMYFFLPTVLRNDVLGSTALNNFRSFRLARPYIYTH